MTVETNDNSAWKAFEESEITHSAAHYLMTIMNLRKQNGYARVTDVAEHLKVSRGAASRAMSMLKDRGWICEDAHRMLELTVDGVNLARNVERNYLVLECFLEDILGLDGDTAREDSCKLEHLLSPKTSTALLRLIRVLTENKRMLTQLKTALAGYTVNCDEHKEACPICVEHDGCIIEQSGMGLTRRIASLKAPAADKPAKR
jgi:DtxR family transcriptional regulator, Mn-dependent transcriptional regulator